MTSWTSEELAKIGNAEELDIASRRPDGTLRPFVTIWVVLTGGDLYVRSVKGRSGAWFQHALAAGDGRIRAGGVERDAAFEEAGRGRCGRDHGLPREVRLLRPKHRRHRDIGGVRREHAATRAEVDDARARPRAASDRPLGDGVNRLGVPSSPHVKSPRKGPGNEPGGISRGTPTRRKPLAVTPWRRA